ncbi:MAG TPA: ATP-binding protein [Terracidiphilus sp.]|nr:ATP-binding protein [Terracidiphilus sp.]
MRIRWWPQSIRWQMLAGLLLLETLSISLFGVLLFRQRYLDVKERAHQRLSYESLSLALQVREALIHQRPGWVSLSVKMLGGAPTVSLAKVTDPAGNMLFISRGDADETTLLPVELALIPQLRAGGSKCVTLPGDQWECAQAIYTGQDLRGFAWVEYNQSPAEEQLHSIIRDTTAFAVIWIVASAVLVLLMARSIAQPLNILHRGARELTESLDNSSRFPLPVAVHNEIGDLIEAFNRMVASLAEQRSGLNDTLSLLDSMLANAPIGLAFCDRNCRLVRVNQVFADLAGVSLSRQLGRTLPEVLPRKVAAELEKVVLRVFETEQPVRNLELSGESDASRSAEKLNRTWTWLVSAYPVRTNPTKVRWTGIIVLDASERKRSEEALRRSEKLAVTGRLAASIAHEINNPLEAITNLLFLMRNFTALDEQAQNYVSMAEHEVRRIAEITQQTLRFYRQSTLPARATMAELLDSVLSLHQGRFNSLDIHVERDYDPSLDLFCFAGEIRQVMANLVGNAVDATGNGGRIWVRARRSHNWKDSSQPGVRFVVADTGAGMEPEVRVRVFEPFFTTKEDTGTGLGLWVSHAIIAKHHGLVHVRSRAATPQSQRGASASGTVFEIFIPDGPSLVNGAAPPNKGV